MTFPNVPLVNPWSHGEEVGEVELWDRVTDKLNKLAAAAPLGQLGSAYDNTAITLANLGSGAANSYPGGAAVVFSLSSQRRVLVFCRANFTPVAATAAKYGVHCVYVAGTTPLPAGASPTYLTQSAGVSFSATTGQVSASNQGDVLLPAGVYVAYPYVFRYVGGAATDVVASTYTAVYDQGST